MAPTLMETPLKAIRHFLVLPQAATTQPLEPERFLATLAEVSTRRQVSKPLIAIPLEAPTLRTAIERYLRTSVATIIPPPVTARFSVTRTETIARPTASMRSGATPREAPMRPLVAA